MICLWILCWIPGTGDLLQRKRESKQSSSVCLLQKSRRSQWFLPAASAAERFHNVSYNFSTCAIYVSFKIFQLLKPKGYIASLVCRYRVMVCGIAVTILIADCSEVKLDDPGQENMTLRWQHRIISNFEYLEYLNRSVSLVF